MVTILSKTTLKKGGRQAVLLGMSHVADKEFYAKVQTEVDTAALRGDAILYEGVSYTETPEPAAPHSELRASMKEAIKGGFLRDARKLKLHLEEDSIRYPSHAIRADVTLSKVVTLLVEQGYPEHTRAEEIIAQLNRKPTPPVLEDVLLHHRDRVVADTIRNLPKEKNVFVTYGEAHMVGICAILMRDGWDGREWEAFYFQL